MACLFPLTAYRSATTNQGTGKRSLVFNPEEALRRFDPLGLPCGKCSLCRASARLTWAIRCAQEAATHDQSCMLTLTYEDRCLPPGGKLSLRDMQLFMKRLRKHRDLRYFWAGEYGPKTRRPHYHCLVFGQDFLAGSEPLPSGDYVAPLIADTWQMGTHQVTPFTMATACYVAGYVDKKRDDPDTMSRMSRNPGIGYRWLARHADSVLRLGHVTIEGRQYPVPPRYLDWMEEALPDSTTEIREARRKYARAQVPLPYTPSKHRSRLINALARQRTKEEKL